MAVLLAAPALAFEDTGKYTEVDAGVHIPVLTKAPTLVTFVEATYPQEAEKKGLAAAVKLMVTIGADGLVADATVTGPAGEGFDEAALEAVKKFVFTPAEVDFAPAPVQIEYVYNFVLKEQPDAGADVSDTGAPDGGAMAKLEGTLFARGSRGRVPAAIVKCDNYPDRETYSNDDGVFSLEVPAGECLVRIAASDFEVFTTKEPLEPGETKEVKYYVLPKVTGFQTVVRDQKEKKEVVRRTITRQEAQRVPGTFGDPIRVIQNFPGVARAPFGLGQLIVRGANPNQTLTFFDGVEIPLLFHLAGGPSVVNAEFLDKVDFFPGGFGARYGRAVGGVVDVSSRKGASDAWHGVAKVDLLDASIFLEVPITDGVSVAAAARRSYIDALLPLVLPKIRRAVRCSCSPRTGTTRCASTSAARRARSSKTGRARSRCSPSAPTISCASWRRAAVETATSASRPTPRSTASSAAGTTSSGTPRSRSRRTLASISRR
ncbi:MAG: TonB family protein [Archangium sp.]